MVSFTLLIIPAAPTNVVSRCIANNILVACITGVGMTFLVFLFTDYHRRAGYLEWTITYLGSLWLGTFAGYIRFVLYNNMLSNTLTSKRFREGGGVARAGFDPERQPLLSSS